LDCFKFRKCLAEKCFFSNLSKTLSIFQEAVAMIKPIGDAEEGAKRLMQEAYQRGSADNITCVVVRFLVNQGTSSQVAPRN
jgi:serine/threonine protein phosphatase PrpC